MILRGVVWLIDEGNKVAAVGFGDADLSDSLVGSFSTLPVVGQAVSVQVEDGLVTIL